MITPRGLAIPLLLGSSLLSASDLSSYRGLQLGMNVASVAKLQSSSISEARMPAAKTAMTALFPSTNPNHTGLRRVIRRLEVDQKKTQEPKMRFIKDSAVMRSAAAAKRKPPRRPPSENTGNAWRTSALQPESEIEIKGR